MTDEQLHEYYGIINEKKSKRRKIIVKATVIVAVIILVITLSCFYLFNWVHVSADELQVHTIVEDGTVYICYDNYPLDQDCILDCTCRIGPSPNPDTFDDLEKDIHYYPQKFHVEVRRFGLLFYPKGKYVSRERYSTDGERLNVQSSTTITDANGKKHTLVTVVNELCYENPDGELIPLYTFDISKEILNHD